MPDEVLPEREDPLGHLAGEDAPRAEPARDRVVLGQLRDRHRVHRPVEDVDPAFGVVERPGGRRVGVQAETEPLGHELDPARFVDAGVLRVDGGDGQERLTGQLHGVRGGEGRDRGRVDAAAQGDRVLARQAAGNGAVEECRKVLLRFRKRDVRRLQERLWIPVALERDAPVRPDRRRRGSREAGDAAEHRAAGVEAPEEHRFDRFHVGLAGDAGPGRHLLALGRGHEAVGALAMEERASPRWSRKTTRSSPSVQAPAKTPRKRAGPRRPRPRSRRGASRPARPAPTGPAPTRPRRGCRASPSRPPPCHRRPPPMRPGRRDRWKRRAQPRPRRAPRPRSHGAAPP